MAIADRIYVVSCGCAAPIRVTAGQAGDTLRCAVCGGDVVVPRLRDLGRFAEVEPVEAAGRSRRDRGHWDVGRGIVLAGVAAALVAATLAAGLGWLAQRTLAGPAATRALRDAVHRAPVGEIHAAWRTVAGMGVRRPPTDDEAREQQFARTADGVSAVLRGVAGMGVVVALVGCAVLATRSTAKEPPR